MALAIVGMPINVLPHETIAAILDGGASVCQEAGIPLAGGHSIDSVEPIYAPCRPAPHGPLGALPLIQGGRTGRALRAPANLRRLPALKRLGSCSGSPAPSPRGNPPRVAQPLLRSTGLLVAKRNPRLTPERPLPIGLAPQHQGLGTPEPQRRTHPAAQLPPGVLGCCHYSGREKGQGPPRHGDLQRPLHQNALAHASAPQRPHLDPPLLSLQSWRIEPAGVLGSDPNPGSAPEGPLPRGLVPQRGGLGTPEPQRWTHLPPCRHLGR